MKSYSTDSHDVANNKKKGIINNEITIKLWRKEILIKKWEIKNISLDNIS